MKEYNNLDRHYTGVFHIVDEQISGELIYNRNNGSIILNLTKEMHNESLFGKSYGFQSIITGKLNTGVVVTLFNNRCLKNHTKAFQHQRLVFIAEYMVWSNSEKIDSLYHKLVCTLENAYHWSGFSSFEESETGIKVKEIIDEKTFNWFGARIKFSSFLNDSLHLPPHEEETKIIQRLVLEIETIEKSSVKELIAIRNKVLSLISFAIKNNVNIEEQYLCDYDDSYFIVNKIKDYRKHYLYTSEGVYDILKVNSWDYNFYLKNIPDNKDINDKLKKLEPIFGLYLSLVKHQDMPLEMVFLNMVQALETFHARFFYQDKKYNYIKSVKKRFGNSELYKKLLLSGAQTNKYCKHIILVSRLNDLLIGKGDGLFCEYYIENDGYAQTIVDTRNYYTHYGKSNESKALKNDKLEEAIYILRLLLEYHVCLVLGIDRRDAIANKLRIHNDWKQLSDEQSKKARLK